MRENELNDKFSIKLLQQNNTNNKALLSPDLYKIHREIKYLLIYSIYHNLIHLI